MPSPKVTSSNRIERILEAWSLRFWHERWNRDEIGFHQAHPAAALTRHWHDLNLKPWARVFVPLCGKSLDLVWLRERGHTVVGVELSGLAVQAFCMENGFAARRRTLANFDLYEAPGLELYRGDFFALEPAHSGLHSDPAGNVGIPAVAEERAALLH